MKIIWLIGIILLVVSVVGDLNPNPYRIRSFTIGDGTNSSLAGTTMGNGTFWGSILATNFFQCNPSNQFSVWNGSGLECITIPNSTILDINATYPIIVTGGVTKTLSIVPEFDDLKIKTLHRNTTGDPFGWGEFDPYFDFGISQFIMGVRNLVYERDTNITVQDQSILINSPNTDISGDLNVAGSLFVDSKDINAELIKSSTKSFQAGYLNASAIYSDIIIMPQDLKLTNITSIVEKTNGSDSFQLNFSIEKYTSYPSSKIEIANYSLNQDINYFNSLDYDFSNNDVVLLNYTSYVNVSGSSTMFKFKVR